MLETVISKPAFRDAFRRRRCLVPADFFYEWQKTPARKQPYAVGLDLLGMAERLTQMAGKLMRP